MNNTIEVYTLPGCPYCKKIIDFFEQHNMDIIHYDIYENPRAKTQLLKRLNVQNCTYPQVFIDDKPYKGCDDTLQAYAAGELDFLFKQ